MSDIIARSQQTRHLEGSLPPASLHAALAGSTPASSQAAPLSRAWLPTWVRPGQQGCCFQGCTFLPSSRTSSPERSWGRPGVCLPVASLWWSGRVLRTPPQFSSLSSRAPDGQARDSAPSPSRSQRSLPLRWSPGPSMVSVPLPEAPSQTGSVSGRPFSPVGRAAPPWRRGESRPPWVGLGLAKRFRGGAWVGGLSGARTPTLETLGFQLTHVCAVQRPSRPRSAQRAPVVGGTLGRDTP